MLVRIDYIRPPARLQVFEQQLVHESAGCIVTLLEHTPLNRTLLIDGAAALEHGSPVVWFTFPGLWHDIGRFHTANGTFTGYYANVLTPVERLNRLHWRTTDLFLDVWQSADGHSCILDEDEFAEAEHDRLIPPEWGRAAREEANRLLELSLRGEWPPALVREWTLDRAIAATR